MLHNVLNASVVAMVAWLGACTGQHTETRQFGDVAMSVTTQPYPLSAGREADVYVTLRAHQRGVSGCRVEYRQFEAGLAPKGDEGFITVPEQSSVGVYRVRSAPFASSGSYRLEFRLMCPETLPTSSAVFDFYVE